MVERTPGEEAIVGAATKTAREARAHEQSVQFSTADTARYLQEVLGQRLTAHIAGVKDPKTVAAWAEGTNTPRPASEAKLRLALQIVHLLQGQESPHVVRAWFI